MRDDVSVVAFFGEPGAVESDGVAQWVTEWQKKCDRNDGELLAVYPKPASKPRAFDVSKLRKSGKTEYVGVFRVAEDFGQLALDAKASAEFDGSVSITIWSAMTDRWPLTVDGVEESLQAVLPWFTPLYGFGFTRPRGKGATLYAYGLAAGLGFSGGDMREADEIGRWMQELMSHRRHLRGMLRDVYPLNILSPLHLSQSVEGNTSLEEWILSSSNRGVLKRCKGLTIWSLNENQLAPCRDFLAAAGSLVVSAPTASSR